MVDGNNNKKKIKGKKSCLTFTLSAAARSSDIWVARMKSTGVVRQHADSAAGYCLSNTLCYSENIVIHLHAFSPQACMHARSGTGRPREPSDLYGGSEQQKNISCPSADVAQLTGKAVGLIVLDLFGPISFPPRHNQD